MTKSKTPSNKNKGEDKISPNSKKTRDKRRPSHEPYREVCAFDDIDVIALFQNEKYKIATSSRLNLSRMGAANCVFDTAAKLNLLREDIVDPNWMITFRLNEKRHYEV